MMLEKINSKSRNAEKNLEFLENQERNRNLGKAVEIATSDERVDFEQENISRIDLEPGRLCEIPTDSILSRHTVFQSLQQDDLRNTTGLAFAALENDDIMADICIPEQHFWLLDMRDSERANVPYLLIEVNSPRGIQNDGPNAHFKGIRPGETLQFGRNHDYGGRFDYSSFTSRAHFEITCSDDDRVFVRDLGSMNGTSVIFANEPDVSDTGGQYDWDFTPRFEMYRWENIKKRGKQLIMTIGDQEYPCLTRDATVFNMSIDTDDGLEPDILIDSDSPEIQEVYNKLKELYVPNLSVIDRLGLVEKIVERCLSYDNTKMKEISKQNSRAISGSNRLIRLGDYVRSGYGVCRQQALLSACLLEKMEQDNLISGTIHVERNWSSTGGHEWATFQENPYSSIYVVDAAMRYVGEKETAPYWDYRRP